MSDLDWDDGPGSAEAAPPAPSGPVALAPGWMAGDFVNGKGLLGLRRAAAPAGGPAARPTGPMDIYEWARRLGDQGIATQMKDGKLYVFETPDATVRGRPFAAVQTDDYVPGQQDDQPGDWRRYPAPANVAQDLSRPVLQDLDAYGRSLAYLSRDPESGDLIGKIQDARIPTIMVPDQEDRFDHRFGRGQGLSGLVYWDPTSALRLANGRLQSPALGLLHEYGHAGSWLIDPNSYLARLGLALGNGFDNDEEERNILDTETGAAAALGEPTRLDHDQGDGRRVNDPTKHTPTPWR